MNKSELIAAVAEACDTSKADATAATEAVFETITNALKDGDTIQMTGFGSFSVSRCT